VWIVPQGQVFRRGLPPPVKGQGRAFVGSGNFRFTTFPEKDSKVEGIIVVAPDTIAHKGESPARPEGSTRRATCGKGEARDGARADTSNARGSRSLNNGAPNRLKRRPEDLDAGESTGPAVNRVKVPKY